MSTTTKRDPNEVKSVMLRMGDDFVACLDELCEVNKRSRREVVEILVDQAHAEWCDKPDTRLNPL